LFESVQVVVVVVEVSGVVGETEVEEGAVVEEEETGVHPLKPEVAGEEEAEEVAVEEVEVVAVVE